MRRDQVASAVIVEPTNRRDGAADGVRRESSAGEERERLGAGLQEHLSARVWFRRWRAVTPSVLLEQRGSRGQLCLRRQLCQALLDEFWGYAFAPKFLPQPEPST